MVIDQVLDEVQGREKHLKNWEKHLEVGFSFCLAFHLSPQQSYDLHPQSSLLMGCVLRWYSSIRSKQVGGLLCRLWRCWCRPVPANLFTVAWKAGMTSLILVALNLTENLATPSSFVYCISVVTMKTYLLDLQLQRVMASASVLWNPSLHFIRPSLPIAWFILFVV